ncbi:jg2103 [Pararge aegeria aegeria]|uniref:Jg2103 protein n=1 Tax=Pararge aegeria aegeria TaxID=348720 RepID=A0A8S4QLJ7_9NEOP|nr:jg2103 [Pararge aegeria aegeria]
MSSRARARWSSMKTPLTICLTSIIFFMSDSVCLLVSSKLLRVCKHARSARRERASAARSASQGRAQCRWRSVPILTHEGPKQSIRSTHGLNYRENEIC